MLSYFKSSQKEVGKAQKSGTVTVSNTTQLRDWMRRQFNTDNTEVWIHNGIQLEKVTGVENDHFYTDGTGFQYTYDDIFDCKYQFQIFTKVIGELVTLNYN